MRISSDDVMVIEDSKKPEAILTDHDGEDKDGDVMIIGRPYRGEKSRIYCH